MCRTSTTLFAGLAVLWACNERAAAQFNPAPGSNVQSPTITYPVLNPYLNLVRGANTPGINLFLGTYPEIDRRNFQSGVLAALPMLGGYANTAQQQVLDINAIPTLPRTGHLAAFQAYGTYYNTPGIQQRPYYPLNPNQARMLPQR